MYFKSNQAYIDAIKSKDVDALRVLLVGIIGSDPTSATTEYKEARKYIKEKSQEIHGEVLRVEEPYARQEDEYTKEKGEWNEEYFQMQLLWLRYNFAVKERLPMIEKIGETVYKDKPTFGKTKRDNKEAQRSAEKKANVVRATGDDQNGIRLFSKEWIRKNFLWIIFVILGLLIIFKIFSK